MKLNKLFDPDHLNYMPLMTMLILYLICMQQISFGVGGRVPVDGS